MSVSQSPPSGIPGKPAGAGPYIAGIVVLGGLIAGLLYWKMKPADAPPAPPPAASSVAPAPVEPPPLHAPPPPPPIEEVEPDAGVDAGSKVALTGSGGNGARGPCSGKCGDGESSPALAAAVQAAARSAQGCYNRALRTSEVSGKMTVSVQVGSSGAVCSASITNDAVNSSEISSCVLGRFRGKTFPPPKSGCVVVNVPINFTIKQ